MSGQRHISKMYLIFVKSKHTLTQQQKLINDLYCIIEEQRIELVNEAMKASKRCSPIKLLSLTFVSKSISKSLLINIVLYRVK